MDTQGHCAAIQRHLNKKEPVKFPQERMWSPAPLKHQQALPANKIESSFAGKDLGVLKDSINMSQQYATVPWVGPAQSNGKKCKRQHKKSKEQQKETATHWSKLSLPPITSQKGLGVTISDNKGSEDKEDGRNGIWSELKPQKRERKVFCPGLSMLVFFLNTQISN